MDDRPSDSLERWIVYRQLCDLLALSPDKRLAERDDWRWEEIVALASRHLVTPSLVEPVARLPSAPDDLKRYLSENPRDERAPQRGHRRRDFRTE